MKASLILLGAICTAAASNVKLINRRDAMPLPDAFVNAIRAVPALRKRNFEPPFALADTPGVSLSVRGLESRQWGCETVGQINCLFEGCCNIGTICGTYGGLPGCCPIGKTCTGVASCKTDEGETSCGVGYCCPKNAKCATDTDGSKVCDYGTSGSTSTKVISKPTALTSTTGTYTPTSTSLSECPGGYSPCAGSDTCCPAGVQCLSGGKCDIKCTTKDIKCGTGCCKDGFTCDTLTSLCEGKGTTDDTGDSSSGNNSSESATPTLRPTTTPGSGGSFSTTGGSSSETSVGTSGGGNSGVTVSSPGSRIAAGMAMAGIVAAVGIALL